MASRFTWIKIGGHLKLLRTFEKQRNLLDPCSLCCRAWVFKIIETSGVFLEEVREEKMLAFKRLSDAHRKKTTDSVEKGEY